MVRGWVLTQIGVGQLLCNIPPSIIESFFMMMFLITGHNINDARRRVDLRTNMYLRRLKLLAYVERLGLSAVWDVVFACGERILVSTELLSAFVDSAPCCPLNPSDFMFRYFLAPIFKFPPFAVRLQQVSTTGP